MIVASSDDTLRSPKTVPSFTAPRPARWNWPLAAIALYGVVFAVMYITGAIDRTRFGSSLSTLAYVPLNLVSVYALWRAGRRSGASHSERSALHLLALMFVFTAVGNLLWFGLQQTVYAGATVTVSDAAYLAAYLAGLAALSRLPTTEDRPLQIQTALVDSAAVLIAIGSLTWTLVVSPTDWSNQEPLRRTLYALYATLSVAYLILGARLLLRQGAARERTDLELLLAFLFVQGVLDLVMQIGYEVWNVYTPFLLKVVCPMLYVALTVAARRIHSGQPAPSVFAKASILRSTNLLLAGSACAVYAVLFWAALTDRKEPLAILVASALALNVLFLLKQALTMRENLELRSARAEAESRARYEERAREGQKLEAVGRLAGGVAHDFNNLLTTVLANSEFALSRTRETQPVYAELTDIRAAANRGAELIQQLLAFRRKSSTAPVVVRPGVVLRESGRLLQRIAGDRCVLEWNLDPLLGAVRVDRGQLEQVFANLISNASDSMPAGGRITLTGRNVVLGESAAHALSVAPGEYVMLGVSDEGTGITSDVRAHIFEPFFSTKPRGKGTGLGLASVYGIVRQGEGGVDVESVPSCGTTFRVYLPRRADSEIAPTAPVPQPDIALNGITECGTILLVEDEAPVRDVTARMLRSAGYHVVDVCDAYAAREYFNSHEHEIALVVTDVMMPGETGPALAAYLHMRNPELPVLFISGYSDADLPSFATGQLAEEHLVQKPFSAQGLLAKVAGMLQPVTHRAQAPAHSPS
jgi:signal transduction histidine kinase/CheY-like chemotaxis protein